MNKSFETVFELFFEQNEVTEIRAIGLTGKGQWQGWAKGTVSGYFDNPAQFMQAAKTLDKSGAEGIYFVMNPVEPTLLARAKNRLVVPKATTTDDQILFHRWLLLDFDPNRPAGISATAAEVKAAIDCRNEVIAFLKKAGGFPAPITAHSGNGGHVLYRLPDLVNNQETTDLKRLALQALNHRFGNNGVSVDEKVFNSARIMKLYGTHTRKGDSTDDRPHRQSYLEEIPHNIEPVTLDQLKWLAGLAQKAENPMLRPGNDDLGRMDVKAYLNDYGIEISRVKQDSGRTIYGLKHCIFNSEHSDNESAIIQADDGKLSYQCFHNSCQGRTWRAARERISGNDKLTRFFAGYRPQQIEQVQAEPAAFSNTSSTLQFPDVMSGIAGNFANLYAEYLEVPKHFFYMGYLTCLGSVLADRLTLASEIAPQPRLYTLLLGESADDRKSTALNKVTEFFKETIEDFQICWGVGSAEGLQKRLGKRTTLLLCLDEFKQFVSKCKIEASVLLPCVNTLFESNRYESQTKKSDINLENAYLSLLAASTVQTYERTWSSAFTDIGFNNRLFLVPGSGERKHSFPGKVPDEAKYVRKINTKDILQHVNKHPELDITPAARELYDSWYMNLERSIHTKRLDTYAMRLMSLLTVNEFKSIVDEDVVYKVIRLMDWQLEVRREYDPIDADNQMAKMEEKIRRVLKQGAKTERELKQRTNAHRPGLWVFEQAKTNLMRADEIGFAKGSNEWFLK